MPTYLCTDIETDGPLVGIHPLRSIGVQVVTSELELGSEFLVNVADHGIAHLETMNWWKKHPKARAVLETPAPVPPWTATKQFVAFVEQFKEPVFVTDAPWFDYAWMRWYCLQYEHRDPFRFRYVPYKWVASGAGIKLRAPKNKLPHSALHDAKEIAHEFIDFKKKMKERA